MSSSPARAAVSSDVGRFRGLVVAAAVGALVATTAALLLTSSAARRGAPGPLSRAHQAAHVACAACHTGGVRARPPATACVAQDHNVQPRHAPSALFSSLMLLGGDACCAALSIAA